MGRTSSSASRFERRGIDLVPDTERYGRPRDLMFLWAGTTMTVFTVVYGAFVVALGLSLGQAVLAIVVGNLLAYPLLGLASVQGPATGTTTLTISRASYGPKGARVLGVFAWLTLVGFEAGGLILVVFAALTLLERAGVAATPAVQIVAIVALAGVQLLLPLFGHAVMMKAQKYFSAVFAVAFAVMAALVVPQVDFGAASTAEGASLSMFTVAVALVMASGGLSWAPSGSNFSRYLPTTASRPAVAWYAALGGFVPYVLLQILGAVTASITLDASDPISGLPGVLPAWFVVPYLVLAMVSLLVQNSTNLYSSGLNLQTAGVPVSRIGMVVADTVLCAVITYVAVVGESFYDMLNAFLGLLVVWMAPWVAVYLTDWRLRRGRYAPAELADRPGDRGRARFGTPGLVAQALGMLVAALWLHSTTYVGPLSTWTGGADLSIPAGLLTASLTYWALARRAAFRSSDPRERATL
ncbi:cytosine permease [Pseudonocardia sp. C8]|uniref:purine-cytosine permease family protein n=1 Tax=Pseudonocardia sp. C8 TaxID=2762759 RepID=UPI0016428D3B|nr:cytosine permease [Pseudonocardia sp. C8]MBC3192279.1 cytosine permease [Pseudonocardia sp. C8]